jgi:hypothetical protein
MDQRTWRTGEVGPATAGGDRAHQVGSVTGWRSFTHETAKRWAWIQVVPTASEDDAGTALADLGERTLPNLRSRVRLASQQACPWSFSLRLVPSGLGSNTPKAGMARV